MKKHEEKEIACIFEYLEGNGAHLLLRSVPLCVRACTIGKDCASRGKA